MPTPRRLARGTLGFLADVILRTRPLPVGERWFWSEHDPWELLRDLYRPTSVLWDGNITWVLLDGHHDDVAEQARVCALELADGPPERPQHRWSMAPSDVSSLATHEAGTFVAEVGVGLVHRDRPAPRTKVDPTVAALHARIKSEFDPIGRLNPGVDVLVSA